jgi:pSer/pThr/pTyr-binding forkhead associated (FHA) protein
MGLQCYRIRRSSENDIVLNNVTVSRRHAEVRCRPDGLFDVIDLDSTVGSYVLMNGEWVQFAQVTVQADEPIRLGEHKATIARLLTGGDPLSRVTVPTLKDVESLSRLATAGGDQR